MNITQTLKRAVLLNSEHIATVFEDRKQTYAQLQNRVARLAAGLQSLGVNDEDRVAFMMLTSDYCVELFYGIPWAGGIVVPLNFRLAPPELIYLLNDSGSKVLVVDHNFAHVVETLVPDLDSVEHIVFAGIGETPEGMINYETLIADNDPTPDAERGGDDTLGIFYTGGTTGLSKGVMITHDNMIILCMNSNYLYPRPLTQLTATPMFHVSGSVPVFITILQTGTHVLLSKFDPKETLLAIQEMKINQTLMVPTMINMVLAHADIGNYDVSSLECIIYGGAPMPTSLITKLRLQLPNCKLAQTYGMTEATGGVTWLHDADHIPNDKRINSVGQVNVTAQIKLLDHEGREVSTDTIGEVVVRGPQIMKGYWNKPELTKDALRDGWYFTGDLGYMDKNGYLYVVDRAKDMIITGGENVYSTEVENVIYKHPAVVLCAVIGIPSETWGEEVHAVITVKADHKVTEQEIIQYCHDHIAAYKCPRSVEIREDSLPLSGAGKILKQKLRAPFWEQMQRQVN